MSVSLFVSLGCTGGKLGSFAGGGTPGAGGADLAAWSSCEPKPVESTGSDYLVQTVPPPFGRNISPATPVVGFLDEGVPLSDVDMAGVRIRVDGEEISYSHKTLEGETGNAVALLPLEPFPTDVDVVITMPVNRDDVEWSFHTGGYEVDLIDIPNFGFEEEVPDPVDPCRDELFWHTFHGFGDLVVTEKEAGPAAPSQGTQHLLMTTGELLAGAAVGSTSTFVTSHQVQTGGANTLSLRTRFFAEEESSAIGREDLLLLVVQGSDGTRMVELGDADSARGGPETSFPGLVDARGGEEEVHIIEHIGELGAPLVLSLYLTDMGDPNGASAVAVDDIRLD